MVKTIPLAPTNDLIKREGFYLFSIILKVLEGTPLREFFGRDSELGIEQAFKMTGMLEKYKKNYFFVMIRELYINGHVTSCESDDSMHRLDNYIFTCNANEIENPEEIAVKAMEKYPACSDSFKFPLHCFKQVSEVLWGKISSVSGIYPKGDLNFMFQFNRLWNFLNEVYYNMFMQLIVDRWLENVLDINLKSPTHLATVFGPSWRLYCRKKLECSMQSSIAVSTVEMSIDALDGNGSNG